MKFIEEEVGLEAHIVDPKDKGKIDPGQYAGVIAMRPMMGAPAKGKVERVSSAGGFDVLWLDHQTSHLTEHMRNVIRRMAGEAPVEVEAPKLALVPPAGIPITVPPNYLPQVDAPESEQSVLMELYEKENKELGEELRAVREEAAAAHVRGNTLAAENDRLTRALTEANSTIESMQELKKAAKALAPFRTLLEQGVMTKQQVQEHILRLIDFG